MFTLPYLESLIILHLQFFSLEVVQIPNQVRYRLHIRGYFLDEMAEFPKRTLDMLRQPLETGKVTISRAASTVTYPAQFLLLIAMNLCPYGYLGSRHRYCTCTPKQILAYTNRISGPIEDRLKKMFTLYLIAV